jgi:hypothetical protein
MLPIQRTICIFVSYGNAGHTTPHNKKYMIIAVSVLIAEFTSRNNGGAARQESNLQSATTYISVRYWQA